MLINILTYHTNLFFYIAVSTLIAPLNSVPVCNYIQFSISKSIGLLFMQSSIFF